MNEIPPGEGVGGEIEGVGVQGSCVAVLKQKGRLMEFDVAGWEVIETEREVHVLPVDDAMSHVRSRACRCEPSVEAYSRHLIVHFSRDGREFYEGGFYNPNV